MSHEPSIIILIYWFANNLLLLSMLKIQDSVINFYIYIQDTFYILNSGFCDKSVFLQIFSICPSLSLWFPHASKNPSLCPYQRKTKSHAWMTGGPLLWPPSSASVLRSWSENTSALCCLLHWTHYNLHTAVTVPQTMLLPSPSTLLSPTWKIRTPMWGCCSWIIVQHLTL